MFIIRGKGVYIIHKGAKTFMMDFLTISARLGSILANRVK